MTKGEAMVDKVNAQSFSKMDLIHTDRTKYDLKIVEELSDGFIGLEVHPLSLLTKMPHQYQQVSLSRTNSILSSIFHLPLTHQTIKLLDLYLLSNLPQVDSNVIRVVELHASSLMQEDFARQLEDLIHNSEFPPFQNTMILLTFREPFDNGNMDFDMSLQLLRMNSMGVVINEFGHGNSTLLLLELYNFDGIKINRFFNELASNNKPHSSFIEVLINHCKLQGKLIMAGVAYTPEEVALFQKLGVDMYDGDFTA